MNIFGKLPIFVEAKWRKLHLISMRYGLSSLFRDFN